LHLGIIGIHSAARYVELQCTSHFPFLLGANSCDELFAQAAQLGIEALAITDRNSLAGSSAPVRPRAPTTCG
jgi:DNA polymerase III alpha subunit